MKREGISTEMYLMDWHLSLFAKTIPLDLVARLWNTYLYDGEVFLVRAGLAILRTFGISRGDNDPLDALPRRC